jgi:hypothetical protein
VEGTGGGWERVSEGCVEDAIVLIVDYLDHLVADSQVRV